jgi:hypothetical protein
MEEYILLSSYAVLHYTTQSLGASSPLFALEYQCGWEQSFHLVAALWRIQDWKSRVFSRLEQLIVPRRPLVSLRTNLMYTADSRRHYINFKTFQAGGSFLEPRRFSTRYWSIFPARRGQDGGALVREKSTEMRTVTLL